MNTKLPLYITAGLTLAVALSATNDQATAATASTSSSTCMAGVAARFIESAPRDRFTFTNTSEAPWSVSKIIIALATAEGNLVFDTEDGGLGVEVFQPYRLETSSASVADVTLPQDGDQSIEIHFDRFPTGADYTFSIDVDDQLENSSLGNIRVSGGELKGTEVVVEFISEAGTTERQTSLFNADNKTVILAGCT